MNLRAGGVAQFLVAVIDGPYDAAALDGVLAQPPIDLGSGSRCTGPHSACGHGTFVMGLLGARRDGVLPGLCPDCELLHIPLFGDEDAPSASVAELARAINIAVTAGARLINLSLAVVEGEAQNNYELAAALNRAEASGAVVVVAAGNQGRLASGQLLSHRVSIPVVAADVAGRPLPSSNFGPEVSRGLAALGHDVLGYAPGGGTTVMSGTSVAAAVAAGTLASLWSERPYARGADVRAAVAHLGPRNGAAPPVLDRELFLAALDRIASARVAPIARRASAVVGHRLFQGARTMSVGNGPPFTLNRTVDPMAASGGVVAPAQSATGCACGAPGGQCTCAEGGANSHFVYVLGSVDIRFPDPSIAAELQDVARALAIPEPRGARENGSAADPLRNWYHQILGNPGARYVARQVCWVLTVEKQPAYYLNLRDPYDLNALIACLAHPEDDLDLFVGSSPLIPVDRSNGFVAPELAVEHLSRFKRADLLRMFRTPGKKPPKHDESAADGSEPSADDFERFYNKIVQSADNFGDTDMWRALNYLAVRYQPLYQICAEMARKGYWFDGVRVATSRLAREKRIVDPIFSFQNASGAVQKHFVRVDVSHLFPMVVNHIDDYVDR